MSKRRDRLGVTGNSTFDGFGRRLGLGHSLLLLIPLTKVEVLANIVRPVDYGTFAAERETHSFGIVASLTEAEPQPMAVLFDANELYGDDVVFFDDFLWVLDAAVSHLRDVDQALYGTFKAYKRAKGHELGDAADEDLADHKAIHGVVPLFGVSTLQRKRNLLALKIDLENVSFHLVANFEQVAGLLATLPSQFGHVSQAVGAAEVNEYTEVGD